VERVAFALGLAALLASPTSRSGSPVPASKPAASESVPPSPVPASPIAKESRQLLVVRTRSWRTSTGSLERFERDDSSPWRLVGESIPVNVGRNGMGWGRGLHASDQAGPVKREGDGRAPAGVFPLALAFGAADELPPDAKGFPYLHTLPTTYCVEDVRSKYYNQIIDANEVKMTSWERWSEMQRKDGLFRWGVVVRQNGPDIKVGAGSCVFLHVWRGRRQPTAGCTAMPVEQIQETVRWLDGTAQPLLVQLPEAEYGRLRDAWALP
jgi:L,D-peptidoglycan transpeptidase YkuD (ErfK/YbiS/YcfS/YnhG family)